MKGYDNESWASKPPFPSQPEPSGYRQRGKPERKMAEMRRILLRKVRLRLEREGLIGGGDGRSSGEKK
jgi:hypothetical protein